VGIDRELVVQQRERPAAAAVAAPAAPAARLREPVTWKVNETSFHLLPSHITTGSTYTPLTDAA